MAHVTGYGAVSSESAMAVINGVHAADLEENVEMRLIREEDSTRERRYKMVPLHQLGDFLFHSELKISSSSL